MLLLFYSWRFTSRFWCGETLQQIICALLSIFANILPLEFDRENAFWFDATVVNADSIQRGYLTLDMNPKLRAFFVPMHTDLKKNQEIGQEVRVKIGFRFDGLSAWEIEQKIK